MFLLHDGRMMITFATSKEQQGLVTLKVKNRDCYKGSRPIGLVKVIKDCSDNQQQDRIGLR